MVCVLLLAALLAGLYTGVPAESREETKLARLDAEVNEMWEIWSGPWQEENPEGGILIPLDWTALPFVTRAGEAPPVDVLTEGETTVIRLAEELPEGWTVRTGTEEFPVDYTDCVWDEAAAGWIPQADFSQVCLIREPGAKRIGISIAYEKANGFLPSGPVLEWTSEDEDLPFAFACYSWGTVLSFQGGMYAYVRNNDSIYGEYDILGKLSAWYDMNTGCSYDAEDRLTSGEEPEGYRIPVRH